MKTRIEHKIHAIADVLFRDMKDGKLDNEGVGLLAGQTGIIIFCKHYLQVFPNSEKEEILEGEMVKSLHRNGMRIVLDVVYNHTASVDRSNFNLTVPGYFYRQNADGSYSDASGCGNQ